jgi:hypothetical protein
MGWVDCYPVAVVEALACDKPSAFVGWTDNTSILGRNVAVVNCRMVRNVARTNRAGRIVA